MNRRIHLDNPRNFNDPFDAMYFLKHYSALNPKDNYQASCKKVLDYVLKTPEHSKLNHYADIVVSLMGGYKNISFGGNGSLETIDPRKLYNRL